MTKKIVFSAALLALVGVMGAAQAAGDPTKGKDLAAMCEGCHGEKGHSLDATFPKLAGQFEKYIEKQMVDYQKGHRSDDTMGGMAMMVTEKQDIKDIGAYFAAQKVMSGKSSSGKQYERGRKLYEAGSKKVYACVNCHGKNGYGKSASNALFPKLGGQHKGYLVKTMKDFKTGARANDPALMMAAIAKAMTDKEIEDVSVYLAAQTGK